MFTKLLGVVDVDSFTCGNDEKRLALSSHTVACSDMVLHHHRSGADFKHQNSVRDPLLLNQQSVHWRLKNDPSTTVSYTLKLGAPQSTAL